MLETSVYIKATKVVDKIVLDNISFLKIKFNFEVNGTNKKFPNIYQTPKLYKVPTKARVIIAAPKRIQ